MYVTTLGFAVLVLVGQELERSCQLSIKSAGRSWSHLTLVHVRLVIKPSFE